MSDRNLRNSNRVYSDYFQTSVQKSAPPELTNGIQANGDSMTAQKRLRSGDYEAPGASVRIIMIEDGIANTPQGRRLKLFDLFAIMYFIEVGGGIRARTRNTGVGNSVPLAGVAQCWHTTKTER